MLEVPQGAGSGFVWDDAGHVVTNFHVINEASDVQVRPRPLCIATRRPPWWLQPWDAKTQGESGAGEGAAHWLLAGVFNGRCPARHHGCARVRRCP